MRQPGGDSPISVRQWVIAAAVGMIAALAIELGLRPSLGHRAAHALGFGIGVALFNAVRTLLRPRGERPPLARIAGESAVWFLVIFVASWIVTGAQGA